MKKKICTLLVAVMCCGAIVGCGDKETESETPVKNNEQATEKAEQENTTDEEIGNKDDTEVNEVSAEEEAALEKEHEESLTVYADMIAEIKQEFPELDIQYIVGKDNGGKDMSIHLELQESKDATYNIVSTFLVAKETLLNNNGITDISVFVNNQGKNEGILLFQNESGRFNPTVNTL